MESKHSITTCENCVHKPICKLCNEKSRWFCYEWLGWFDAKAKRPKEQINPVTQDFCEYPVIAKFEDITDVRYYKYGNGHWYNGPQVMDEYVTAWFDIYSAK